MSKQAAYAELVRKRKKWKFLNDELTNPSQTNFDVDEIEPWAQWQNNLDAKVLVVGQEFCDVATYIETKGTVELHPGIYRYPSNRNLRDFLSLIGLDPGHPLEPNKANPVFFTNCVVGLKPPPMSANFKDRWMMESREEFLLPLIRIIQPRVIVPIGTKATQSLGRLFNFQVGPLSEAVANSVERDGMMICPVFHTGGLGLRNRPRPQQEEDWKRILKWL